MAASHPDELKTIRDKIDNYETTVLGLQGFRWAVTFRQRQTVPHNFSLGRRMTPRTPDTSGAKDDVTPDAVIQIEDTVGYVVEAKRTLPQNHDYWQRNLSQIRKYDQELTGWWTTSESLATHNVAILLWTRFVRQFARFLDHTLLESGQAFTQPVSVIEFSRIREAQESFFFRRDWGSLEDPGIESLLADGISVPLEVIIGKSDKQWKFYDSPPVTEYMMTILWQHVFNSRLPDVEFDRKLGAWPMEVTVPDLAQDLQKLYGTEGGQPRERRFPRSAWVRDALDAFARIDLADHIVNDRYLVRFKTLRTTEKTDLIARFSRHRAPPHAGGEPAQQLTLFPSASDPEAT